MRFARSKALSLLYLVCVGVGWGLAFPAETSAQRVSAGASADTIFGVGIHGFLVPGQEDGYPRDPERDQDLKTDTDPLFGASIVYGYTDRAVVFSVGQLSTTLRNGGIAGDVHIMPFLVTGQWRFYGKERILVPFVGLGAGVYRIRFSPTPDFQARLIADTASSGVPLMNPRIEISDSIGIHGSAGLEVLLGERFGLLAEVQYHRFRTHARIDGTINEGGTTVKRSVQEFLRLDTPVLGVALRVYF